jgi:cytochrome b involved in lipid metabolism
VSNLNKIAIPKNFNNLLKNADVVNGIILFNGGTRPLPTNIQREPLTAQNISQQELAVINQVADQASAFTRANPGGVATNLVKQTGVDAYGNPVSQTFGLGNYKWLLPVLLIGGFFIAKKLIKK